MAIPQRLDPEWTTDQVCSFAQRWLIDFNLAFALHRLAARLPFAISIISGWRSCEHQEQLRREPGSNATTCDLSTHTTCPATGADLWPAVAITRVVKVELGAAARLAGLRWGGGSRIDPETGIPSDWNHVDLGRREH